VTTNFYQIYIHTVATVLAYFIDAHCQATKDVGCGIGARADSTIITLYNFCGGAFDVLIPDRNSEGLSLSAQIKIPTKTNSGTEN